MNQQNTNAVSPVFQEKEASLTANQDVDLDSENDDLYTFDTGLLIVENCVFNLLKANYKDINVSDLKATLTLDKSISTKLIFWI